MRRLLVGSLGVAVGVTALFLGGLAANASASGGGAALMTITPNSGPNVALSAADVHNPSPGVSDCAATGTTDQIYLTISGPGAPAGAQVGSVFAPLGTFDANFDWTATMNIPASLLGNPPPGTVYQIGAVCTGGGVPNIVFASDPFTITGAATAPPSSLPGSCSKARAA